MIQKIDIVTFGQFNDFSWNSMVGAGTAFNKVISYTDETTQAKRHYQEYLDAWKSQLFTQIIAMVNSV